MFRSLSLKWVALVFVVFNLINTLCAAIVMQVWLSDKAITQENIAQLTALAETDPFIALISGVIGGLSGLITSWWLTAKTHHQGFSSLYAYVFVLLLFGLASIVMHPEHAMWQQLGKLIAPLAIGWLVHHRFSTQQAVQPA